jgi:hypothetical protein
MDSIPIKIASMGFLRIANSTRVFIKMFFILQLLDTLWVKEQKQTMNNSLS